MRRQFRRLVDTFVNQFLSSKYRCNHANILDRVVLRPAGRANIVCDGDVACSCCRRGSLFEHPAGAGHRTTQKRDTPGLEADLDELRYRTHVGFETLILTQLVLRDILTEFSADSLPNVRSLGRRTTGCDSQTSR